MAAIMATTVMVMGSVAMNASALLETRSWSASHVNYSYVPSYASQTGYAYLAASDEVYTGSVTSMSDITNRRLTLSCTSHPMTTGSIVYNNTGSRTWRINGIIGTVTYKMNAYTSLEAELYVSGTVSR